MRLAVLISGYIVLALCVTTVMNLIAENDPSTGITLVGLVMLATPIILGVIYAHRNK